MNDINSLSHTKWNCKYHIVFAPKYRRKVFYGEKRREIGEILRTLCNWKKVKIIEAEVCPDHVHMLLEIPPKVAISSFMGYLKGKSSLMIYDILASCPCRLDCRPKSSKVVLWYWSFCHNYSPYYILLFTFLLG